MASPQLRRVVVTGIGAVTPLGYTFVDTWKKLLKNESGILSLPDALQAIGLKGERLEIELDRTFRMPCQVAAVVRDFERDGNRSSRFAKMAMNAAAEAVEKAGLNVWWGGGKQEEKDKVPTTDDDVYLQRKERAGVSIGSGLSGVRAIAEMARLVDEFGQRLMKPHFVPKVLTNSAAARVSIQFGLKGPNLAAATACAAGSHAIGDAARCIQTNMADIMLAGGTESCIDPLSLGGFVKLRALSTSFNDHPAAASRPFDKDRDGFVMGEGACVLVLEELEHAIKRFHGAESFIELVGYGATGDGHHITAPDPTGRGAMRAMQMAVKEAGIDPMDVQYVNAHATSTPMGDEIEAKAIHQALCSGEVSGEQPLQVSSTKGSTGHLLGAAGAIEAAFTVQSLLDQRIPATRNLQEVQPEVADLPGMTYVQGDAIQCDDGLNIAMSNSFGFGGTNSCLLFQRLQME